MNSGTPVLKPGARTKRLQTMVTAVSPITGDTNGPTLAATISAPATTQYRSEVDDYMHPLVKKMKDTLLSRGSGGILGLQRKFRSMDDDGSRSLNMAEFKKALKEMALSFTDLEISTLFQIFGNIMLDVTE